MVERNKTQDAWVAGSTRLGRRQPAGTEGHEGEVRLRPGKKWVAENEKHKVHHSGFPDKINPGILLESESQLPGRASPCDADVMDQVSTRSPETH